jgi:DNA-binding PadR family transcriptional regulator
MRISCDEAFKRFCRLIQQEWSELSEADTRSKIIDPIFINCLNWLETDFTREDHNGSGYSDYLFRVRTLNSFVVEAKSKGTYFNIPIGYNFRRRLKIGGAISQEETIKKALAQTQKYCVAHGARYGVVTNGEQYIVFEAMRFGGNWEDGNCIIFYNLDDIKRHFVDFWNLLSKDAVEKNSFLEIVSRDIEELNFVRPIDNVIIRNFKEPRNHLYRYITPIIDYAFNEITSKDKLSMLEKCYVFEDEFDEVDRMLKSEFSMEMPLLYSRDEIKKIIQDKKTSGVFQRDFYKNIDKLGSGYGEPILLLLLGGVGSGKTTFIHRFFKVVLPEKEREKKLWFYIDWRAGPTEIGEIRSFILKQIVGEFHKKYDTLISMLKDEFNIEDIPSDLDSIKHIFAILKALGYVLSLVVDNVDQHKSSSPTFHENVFIEANYITTELRIITIMTLREESYYMSSDAGVFNAYYIQKYVINAPDFIKLILYRLDFILEKLKLPEKQFKEFLRTNVEFEGRLPTVKTFLEIIRDSFSRPRTEISDFMAKTSGGDMRRTLQLFGTFLMSGNTKIDEILTEHKKSGTYWIASHQLLKSIMLGEYKYYSEEPSYLMNIFDFNTEYSKDHFLNLKILRYAEEHLTNITAIGRGFIEINQLMKEANNLLISPKATEDSLTRMSKRNLIVLDTRARGTIENASYFRITECGSYYLNKLIKTFAYLDGVWMDTPIADGDVVDKLRSIMDTTLLDVKMKRTRIFLDYLLQMEQNEKARHPESQSSPLGRFSFVKSMISGFEKEQVRIHSSFKNKYISRF